MQHNQRSTSTTPVTAGLPWWQVNVWVIEDCMEWTSSVFILDLCFIYCLLNIFCSFRHCQTLCQTLVYMHIFYLDDDGTTISGLEVCILPSLLLQGLFSPFRLALQTMSAAARLITCTTYRGQLASLASMMERLVASSSTYTTPYNTTHNTQHT